MTFRQKISVVEDNFGKVDVYINFAEDLDDLLDTTPANVVNIDFLDISKINKKVDLNASEITTELSFSFNNLDTRKVSSFENFIFNNSITKFVNVCFGTLTANDIAFTGVVQNEYEAEDLAWNSLHYATSINNITVFNMKAKPYAEVIQQYELSDILDAIKNDTSWQNTYVANRKGYFTKTVSADVYDTKALNLVQLEDAIIKIFTELANKISNDYSTITFNFNDIVLPFKLHPARFQLYEYRGTVTRLVKPLWAGKEAVKIYQDDYYSARLQFTSPSTNISPIFISASLLYATNYEPNSELAKQDRWERYEDAIELIRDIAASLGVYVKYYFISANTIKIEFIAPTNFVSNDYVYIYDATKSKLNVTSNEVENDKNDKQARAFYLAKEGLDEYSNHWDDANRKLIYSKPPQNLPKENLLPLSLSTTICYFESIHDEYANRSLYYYEAGLPHNFGLFKNNICDLENNAATGITSAIFMRVGEYLSNPYNTYEPNDAFYVPAAAIRTKINDIEVIFDNLSNFYKAKMQHNAKNYLYEREIELPFIFNFSNNNMGSAAWWSKLELGKKILINSSDYIISEISYDLQNWTTTIKLYTDKLFAFEAPTTDALSPITASYQSFLDVEKKPEKTVSSGIAYNVIRKGEAVSLRADSTYERALSKSTHATKVVGIAMNTASAGSLVFVQKSGEATTQNAFSDLTTGQLIYLRIDNLTGPNISTSPLTEKTVDEDLYCILGIATAKDKYLIKITDYILE